MKTLTQKTKLMKFIKLEILNLASLDRQGGEVINFEEGALGDSTIFSIVGPTGSGKSTILDAICLALYNRAPRYPRQKGDRNQRIEIYGKLEEGENNRLAPTDSRNILTRDQNYGYSKLTFKANNGAIYRAEWSVRKLLKNYGRATTSLFKITTKDGRATEEQAEWDKLPQIIGLDYDQFLRTVLIAQGSFSSFIKAKEDERYELLEKLIGSEELYTSIAAKIKEQKDEAAEKYKQIEANFSAQEKDIIPEEELTGIETRIAELEDIEKQAQSELLKITEAIAWHIANEKYLENIAKYERAFNEARQKTEDMREQADRLALHDATLDAVALYKDRKAAEANMVKVAEALKSLGEKISTKEQEINVEEKVNLAKIKQNLLKATTELEEQRPHINKARAIKVELEGLKKAFNEKAFAKADAENAKKKADKEFSDNKKAIESATADLQKSQQRLAELQEEIRKGEAEAEQKAQLALTRYNEENAKCESCDATKLQEANTHAEKTRTDLNSAIRIQTDLKTKRNQQKESLGRQKELTERNNRIAEQLKSFEIEKLTEEFETLNHSYTLMISERWELHRASLMEGEACPLCGATHHPYHNTETIAPVVDKMKSLIDEKRKNLNKQREMERQLTEEQAKNKGLLDGISASLNNLEKEIAKLNYEWAGIHEAHENWSADTEALRSLMPETERNVDEAAQKLKHYNNLVKHVEELRKEKETAENNKREYERISLEKKLAAEKKIIDAETMLKTEEGKTENLKAHQAEKANALKTATEALTEIEREVASKTEALKQEIGEKDPDAFEKELNTAKTMAESAVTDKTDAISHLREQLKELKGKEDATKKQKDSDHATFTQKKEELAAWLAAYNAEKAEPLTEEIVANLCSATDNWEEIRDTQKQLRETYTSRETTLSNEKKAHNDHQEKRPEKQKEELAARKEEIESRSNEELINLKARLQRHNAVKKQMGEMATKREEAISQKSEWEEISDAIGGSDGKTLRKIAQCYTLRFLIEHANVEIRKFNSRYELQQVKNSLGIRVIDHDRADDVRDTTSLSGGETFIVSLGLALGLSALSSRNISFGNLFIDEGFGTLDPDTLATVIDSLAMLQSSQGKKVGVISHTDTMSERITTQIRIIKNGNSGSSHIEIYP